jgi:hypothetical protein
MKALVFLVATPQQQSASQPATAEARPASRKFSFTWKQVKTAAARVPIFS